MDSKKGHCPMDITCTLHRYPDTTIRHHVDMSKTKNLVLNLLKLIRCKKVQLYLIFRLIHGIYFIARRSGGKSQPIFSQFITLIKHYTIQRYPR